MAAAATQKIDVIIGAKDMFSSTMKQAESQFDKYGKSVIAITAKITGATIALSKTWDLASDAARFDQQEQAFTNLAASYGVNAQNIIDDLKRISGQTISTAAVIESAGNAMLLGIPAEEMSQMMEIARASARITGQSVQEAFNDIATGIGRQSPMILDNLGITIKLGNAYQEYAASIGKTVPKLTDAEKKQAFLNAAMKSGQEIVKRTGESTLTAADAQAIFIATMQDMRIVAGKVIISVSSALSGIAFTISKVFAQTLKTAATGIGKIDQLLGKLPFFKATPGILEFADAQGDAAAKADRLMRQSFKLSAAIWEEKKAVDGLKKSRAEPVEIAEEKEKEKKEKEEERIRKENEKIISLQQEKFKRLHDLVLESDLNDREMSALKLMRQLEEMEVGRIRLVEANLLTKDLNEQFRIAEQDAHLLHEQRLTTITAKEAAKKIALEKNIQKLKFQTAVTGFNNILALTGTQSKKTFKAVQILNAAVALNDSKSAILGAYKHGASIGGPLLGGVYAGLAVAAVGPLVSAIGGGSVGVGDGGDSTPSISPGTQPTGTLIGTEITEETRSVQNITIIAKALDPSEVNWDKYTENMVDSINKAGKERDVTISLEAVAR